MSVFTKNLKKYRCILGITARELMLRSGLSDVAISMYEKGKRSPSLHSALKIAEGLGVTVNDLAYENPPHKECPKCKRMKKTLEEINNE